MLNKELLIEDLMLSLSRPAKEGEEIVPIKKLEEAKSEGLKTFLKGVNQNNKKTDKTFKKAKAEITKKAKK